MKLQALAGFKKGIAAALAEGKTAKAAFLKRSANRTLKNLSLGERKEYFKSKGK